MLTYLFENISTICVRDKATVVNLQSKRNTDKEIIHNLDIIQLKFISCNIPLLQNFCLVLHLWLMSHIRSEVADII